MGSKILVIGPGKKTEGGITSVIKEYSHSKIWRKYNCKWIETYNNKNNFLKITFFFNGFVQFLMYLPFSKIIHIHFSWKTSVLRKTPFLFFSKILGKKVIIHLHSGAEQIIQSDVKKLYQYFFNKADITILLANTIKDQLSQEFSFKKTVVVYNPCNRRPSPNRNQKMKNILFAGHINDKKGIFDLISAFSKISPKHPSWKLQIAGSGDIQKLNKVLDNLKIRAQTDYLGWIKNQKKIEAFETASIFCLPSYTEGFPMAVLEAWAFGLPVVTTPVGGLQDIIQHRKNALVFEPGDIKGLANSLEELIKSEKLRKSLGKESVQLVQEHFHIDSIANEIDELYQKILM